MPPVKQELYSFATTAIQERLWVNTQARRTLHRTYTRRLHFHQNYILLRKSMLAVSS